MNKINSSKVRIEFLKQLNPITQAQGKVFQTYAEGANLCLNGSAGTGKTYIGLYLALQDVLDKNTQYNKVVIVRSIVPTRDIGFLPGTEEEKKTKCKYYCSPCNIGMFSKGYFDKHLKSKKHLNMELINKLDNE